MRKRAAVTTPAAHLCPSWGAILLLPLFVASHTLFSRVCFLGSLFCLCKPFFPESVCVLFWGALCLSYSNSSTLFFFCSLFSYLPHVSFVGLFHLSFFSTCCLIPNLFFLARFTPFPAQVLSTFPVVCSLVLFRVHEGVLLTKAVLSFCSFFLSLLGLLPSSLGRVKERQRWRVMLVLIRRVGGLSLLPTSLARFSRSLGSVCAGDGTTMDEDMSPLSLLCMMETGDWEELSNGGWYGGFPFSSQASVLVGGSLDWLC